MCYAQGYKSSTCGHKWLTITRHCTSNRDANGAIVGFNALGFHEFLPESRTIFGSPQYLIAAANSCPKCDRQDQYDGNVTRMVIKENKCHWNREANRNGYAGEWPTEHGGMGTYQRYQHQNQVAAYQPQLTYYYEYDARTGGHTYRGAGFEAAGQYGQSQYGTSPYSYHPPRGSWNKPYRDGCFGCNVM